MVDNSHSGSEKRFGPVKRLFLGEVDSAALFPFPEVSPAEAETLGMVLESVDRFMT